MRFRVMPADRGPPESRRLAGIAQRWRAVLRGVTSIDRLARWLDAERDRLPLWLPVFMGTGAATYYALRFEPPAWIGPLTAVWALVAAVRFVSWRPYLAPVAALALGFAAGQVATARSPPIEAALPAQAVVVSGSVLAVDLLPEGRRIVIQPATLEGASAPLVRSVRVRLRTGDETPVEPGDEVNLRALVRPPSPPSYPGGWDLQRDAFYAGLGASGFALGPLQRTHQSAPTGLARRVQWLRQAIAARILATVPGSAGAVDVTLLTGHAMAIPANDHAAFRDSGLAHLLAVAGLHIGIVMGWILLVTRQALALSERASLRWPTKKIAACAALAAGGCYMVLTGMHVPIRRSFVMACLVTAAILGGRNPVSVRGLALAAAVLVLLAPFEVPNVSFQMSFSAVLALIAGYEALRPWLRQLHGRGWRRRFAAHLGALALSRALAGAASAPYCAYHFGHVQLYFILANMVAVPLTALWVMPAGLIALALMPLHLEWLALVPMGWGTELILWVARATSALPGAVFAVPHMPLWGLCVFSLGLAWLGLWRTRVRLGGVVIMAIGLASPVFDDPPDLLVSADGRLIAADIAGTIYLQQSQGGSRFTRDAWLQFWGADATTPFPDVGEAADGALRCGRNSCLLRPYPDRKGALLARGLYVQGCDQAAVLLSADPARGLCSRPYPALVDRFTVWRDGSTAIWLEPAGARVVTDRQERGTRPWVPPPPKPRPRPAPTLPPAPIDPG